MSASVKTRAKTLKPDQFERVLSHVSTASTDPLRDRVVFLLSYRAGLRVAEIAGLSWRDVTDAEGNVRDDSFDVPADIAKKGSGRTLPMHPELYAALVALSQRDWATLSPRARASSKIVRNRRGAHMVPNTLQRYISRTYDKIGFTGCSSHSGRRTFLTTLAQRASEHDCSLRDIQLLAGHRDISTTEAYFDVSAGVRNMVRSL